jgi:mannose-6-phosphate isomerase-like protein (cupin superfamily)
MGTDADDWMFSLAGARAKLPDDPDTFRFFYGLRHGTMKIGLYAPRGRDTQGPHRQDELYIVISGSGEFVKGDNLRACGPQDVIFVEAGVTHHFQNFSEDFATWVIFWGAEGGEA